MVMLLIAGKFCQLFYWDMCIRKRSSIKIRIPNWEGKEKYMEKGLLCRLCFVVTGKK